MEEYREGIGLCVCGSREGVRQGARRGVMVLYEEVRCGREVCEGDVGYV